MDESEYFSLQDLDVSSGLKEKIEGYVSPLPDSTPERYGRINLDFEGQCPLRQKSGLCGLQVEKGEAVLPSICRQYPRSPRLHPIPSATISDSCEWVLEKLCLDKEKLRRISYPLSFEKIDEEAGKDLPASFAKTTDQILLLLSDRSLPFTKGSFRSFLFSDATCPCSGWRRESFLPYMRHTENPTAFQN
jgi:hypothetical protein